MGKIGFGRLGRVIDHVIDKFVELIIETRKGYNQYAFLYNASGDDSVPCKEDRIIIIKIDGTGRFIAAGVLTDSQGAKPGEKIFFTRDADANIVSKISMLNNGSITIDTKTETTDDATGEYNRIIKGKTDILEKDNRTYKNEKDVHDTIEGNREKTIKKNETITIEENRGKTIKKNETITIEGDRTTDITGDNTKTVGGDENIAIEGDKTENVTGNTNESTQIDRVISAGGGITIEAGGTIEIKAGGNIKINGQIINLN
jgi:hypothetical protein